MAEYDPEERRRRYLENEQELKGRKTGVAAKDRQWKSGGAAPAPKKDPATRAAAAQRVKALTAKLAQLKAALAAASAKSGESTKPSAGESKLKEKQANEKYYNENKNEIANDRKAEARSSSKSPSTPASSGTEPRSAEELKSAIRSTLTELKAAVAKLRTL